MGEEPMSAREIGPGAAYVGPDSARVASAAAMLERRRKSDQDRSGIGSVMVALGTLAPIGGFFVAFAVPDLTATQRFLLVVGPLAYSATLFSFAYKMLMPLTELVMISQKDSEPRPSEIHVSLANSALESVRTLRE